MKYINIDDKHCMIDLETLGITPQAPIIQIGIACFTLRNGIEASSEVTIDFDEAIKHGKADGSTIKWWLRQSEEARVSVTKKENFTSVQALDKIANTLSLYIPTFYWAHATFDFPIINNLIKEVNHWFKFPYRNCFDLRTLEYLTQFEDWPERKGIGHTAMDDAIYQAECVILMLNKLRKEND